MKVTCKDFHGNYEWLNGSHEIPITKSMMMQAAITEGAPTLQAYGFSGLHAISFAIHKMSAITSIANFSNDNVTLPRGYDALDPSEKNVLSYWMGMTMAKVMAEHFFGVPRLSHAFALNKLSVITLQDEESNVLPDFVGHDNDFNWFSIEAKCYKIRASETMREYWKGQAHQIAKVYGSDKLTHCYCFTKLKPKFSVELVDPPIVDPPIQKRKDGQEIKVDPMRMQNFYYRPFVELLDEKNLEVDNKLGVKYKEVAFDSISRTKFSIGIMLEVLDRLEKKDLVMGLQSINLEKVKNFVNSDTYIGSDGIAVKLETV
jgi:hypothetical protein